MSKALAGILLFCAYLSPSSAAADNVPARIVLGTREVALAPSPVYDGARVLAPMGVLDTLGASYVASTEGNTVSVLSARGRSGEVPVIDVDGSPMLPMDKVMEVIGGESAWARVTRTLTLTAHLESVEFVDGVLKVNCSFPVVCSVDEWNGKIMLDVSGAKLSTEANEVYVGSPVVERARLGQYAASTARVVLDTLKPVGFKLESRLPASQLLLRVSEDLPHTPTKPATPPKVGKQQPYTISAIRAETLSDTRLSLVIATSGRGAVEAAYGVMPPQIVLHLPGGTLAEGAASTELSHPLIKAARVAQASISPAKARITLDLARICVYSVRIEDNAVLVDVGLPLNAGGKLAGKLVVIDPGHGGREKGAGFNGIYEKDVNYRIASAIAEALRAQGARTMFTRNGDHSIGLAARSEVAIDNGADFFISVHCNSNGTRNNATGIETYYHKQESSPRALAFAIHAGVCSHTGMRDRKARSDSSLYASGLGVLRRLSGSSVPGILLECGFLNHSSDRSRLLDSGYRKKLAAGVVAGLKAYVEGTPLN